MLCHSLLHCPFFRTARVSVWKDQLELTEFTGAVGLFEVGGIRPTGQLEIRDTSFSNASNQKHLSAADWGIAARSEREINWVARWHPRELLKPLAEELNNA